MEKNKVKPITPEEAAKRVEKYIPDEVISVINDLIVEGSKNGCPTTIRISFNELLLKLDGVETSDGVPLTLQNMAKNHWFDVEDIYRRAGWVVKRDCEVTYYANDYRMWDYLFTRK